MIFDARSQKDAERLKITLVLVANQYCQKVK